MLELTRKKYQETFDWYNKTKFDGQLSTIWANNMPDIYKIFNESKTAEELIDRVDQCFLYAINFPPENSENTGVWRSDGDEPHIREKHIDWLLEKQKSVGLDLFKLQENIQESVFIHPRNKVYKNGRILSGNFLRTLSITNQIFKHLGTQKSVLELGAGCGHQARTWMLMSPESKYTIVDLPETLIFSFTHLSLCFPNKKLLWVTSEEDIGKMEDYDIVFIPAIFAPLLHGREYDLFQNSASLGEMNNPTIHKWMDFIQNKATIKNLYTLNRFLNVVDANHANFRKGENECSTSYDHEWYIKQWELEPNFTRSPFIDTLHSRYVEIIASRPDARTNYKERSEQLLKEVMDEDWYRLGNMFGDGVMSMRRNRLTHDLTMTGTLFKLWESIRLDQSVSNVDLMLKYLERLLVGCEYQFEEVFYYRDLLARLKSV